MKLAYAARVTLAGAPHTNHLLGRASELALLEAALGGALSGFGSLVLVSGDAGLGKSALVAEAARLGRERGFAVALGRAWEFADAPPCFPLRSCLRSLGVDPRSAELDGEAGAFLLWESVLEALADATRDKPALWIVEDVHAADLATLDLLVFLAQPLRALRALVIVTTRPNDARLTDPMLQRLTRLAREAAELLLEPLSRADVDQLATGVLQGSLDPGLAAQLFERSAGNPLFVVEYARAIRAARGHPGALSTLPTSLRQLVLERARFLPEACLSALRAAAVLGREFSAGILARMLGAQPARAIDDVLPALKNGLVQELEPGKFRFSHVLVRDALYESSDASERARLHALAADTLASGEETTDRLIERVQHALSGLPQSDAQATQALAARVIAVLEAQHAADRAFALERRLDEARRAALLPPASAEVLLEAARLGQAAGRFGDAKRICEDLMARAKIEGDGRLMARAALLMGSALTPSVVDAVLVTSLREAHAALGDADPELACMVWARLAAALQPAPDPMQPVGMAREAIDWARASGDQKLLCEVLFYAGSALVDFAPIEERLAAADELLRVALATAAPARALQACVRLALDRAVVGDFAGFDRAVDGAHGFSQDLGHAPRYRWRPLMLNSMRASMRGDFAESERLIVELEQLSRQYAEPALELALKAHDLMTKRSWRQDDATRAALPNIAGWMGVPDGFPVLAMFRAAVYARLGDRDGAARDFSTAAPHSAKFEHDADYCTFAAEAAAFVGDQAICERMRETLLRSERTDCVIGHIGMTYEGPAARALGLLHAALGAHADALVQLEIALELVTKRGQRPYAAQIEYELGTLLEQMGRKTQARERFDGARARAAELGMTGLVRAVEQRVGEPVAAPARSPLTAAPGAARFALAPDGDVYRCSFDGRAFSLRQSRGVALLSELVAHAGEELHVLALAAGDALGETSAGTHLDEQALRDYRARLRELESDLDEAELSGDRGRSQRLAHERDALVGELSRAVGLGGRARKAGSATERARVNVQKRLKDAVARVGEVDPEAGRYLAAAVRTGTYCSFRY